MAKPAVVSALLLIALWAVVAEASFRTTITTTVEEDEDNQQSQRCQQQIQQRMQQLRQCRQMLMSGQGGMMMNQFGQGGQQQHSQCCQALENMNRQCRCEAVNHMVRQMMQGEGGRQSERMQEMMERARNLPDMCNLEPRQCQIQPPWAF